MHQLKTEFLSPREARVDSFLLVNQILPSDCLFQHQFNRDFMLRAMVLFHLKTNMMHTVLGVGNLIVNICTGCWGTVQRTRKWNISQCIQETSCHHKRRRCHVKNEDLKESKADKTQNSLWCNYTKKRILKPYKEATMKHSQLELTFSLSSQSLFIIKRRTHALSLFPGDTQFKIESSIYWIQNEQCHAAFNHYIVVVFTFLCC